MKYTKHYEIINSNKIDEALKIGTAKAKKLASLKLDEVQHKVGIEIK